MRPDISPESISAELGFGGSRTGDLKDTRSDSQTRVGSHDLDAGNFLCQFTASPGSKRASVGAMSPIYS
jgi:hypothetical protein